MNDPTRTADLSARNRLRACRDIAEAYKRVHVLAETHKDLAHMSLVLFANGRRESQRLSRCLRLLFSRRALILDTMSEPCSQGYSAAVVCIMEVDQMIFNLRTRIHVSAAVDAFDKTIRGGTNGAS